MIKEVDEGFIKGVNGLWEMGVKLRLKYNGNVY
jgi:hypothetical protein